MTSNSRKRGILGLSWPTKLVGLMLLGAVWWSSGNTPSGAPERTESVPAAASAAGTATAETAERPVVFEGARAFTLQDQEGAEGGGDHGTGGGEEEHHLPASSFFLILVSILVAAKLLGELAERIGQPAVLGELVAGVLLGGSVLGIVPTEGFGGEVIHLLAEVGVAILLFEIGLETDLKEMFRVGASSAAVATVGVVLPFLLGFLYWILFFPAVSEAGHGVSHTLVAIFVGATLTATSVGITARVLTDLHLMHRSESRIIIGAAVIDDVLGLVILAVVAGLVQGDAVTALGIGKTFVVAVGFLVVAVMVGNMIAPQLFSLIDRMRVRGVLLVSALAFALIIAALADKAGSAMIIGSFAAGIVLSSTNQFDLIVERIEPVADVFTPIFFVSVGAAVNLGLFLPFADDFNVEVIKVGVILTVIAVIGKLLAGFVVGWGKEKLNHTAIGVGMIPRGEVGLIFAQIGLAGGVLTEATFSAILIMVIATTFIAPPLLKIVFRSTDEPPPHLSTEVPESAAGA